MVPHSRSRLAIVSLLFGVVAALGWLLFGVGGDRSGMLELHGTSQQATVLMWKDAPPSLTIEDVHGSESAAWRVWEGRDYIVAAPQSATWIKVTLRNLSPSALSGVLADSEYFTDRVELWEVTTDAPETWRHEVAGEAIRNDRKSLGGRFPAFAVELPVGSEKTFYLRIEDRFVAASRLVWWPKMGDYLAVQLRSVLAESVCYGVLAALLLYHAILWVRLRHADIAWYVLAAAALVTFNFVLNGGTALLGWAMASPAKETVGTLALGLHSVFLVLFAREFLELRSRFPRADGGVKGLMLIGGAISLGALATPWMRTTDWLYFAVPASIVVQVSLLIVAVVAWRRGASHARFLILGSGAMLVSAFPAVINWLLNDNQHAGAMGVLGGSALEILLLSLAVADRFSQAQRDKQEAQRRLLEEAAARQAVQEAYADELEVEVRERTRELEAANADKDRMITVLAHDLRGPLTGLTRSGEHAARATTLSVLSEFAADAAATGRHLLLMIEDLVLWARLRAGAGQVASCSVHVLVAPAAALHRSVANRGGVELVVDVAEELRVETDVVLVQTLVRNLVDNAVRHAKRRVEIVAREEGEGGVRVNVRDDGPGLPTEVADWFVNADVEASRAGSGLGLRLCLEIAEALGVPVSLKTEEGIGTEFSFVLKRELVAV